MTRDASTGWDAISDRFIAARSDMGAALVRAWASERLPAHATILHIGCGSGIPIARTLVDAGFSVWGVDAAPSLIAAYRRNLPDMPALCEPVQTSRFFGRRFVGVLAIGLVFLLDEGDQRTFLATVADLLEPGGRFLFSAPRIRCHWRDTLTGRESVSLGADVYAACLAQAGLDLDDGRSDEGGNDYHDAVKPA